MQEKPKNRTQQFQDFLKSDRAILMICISIALIFWLLIRMSQRYRTTADVLLTYTYPEDKTFVDRPPQNVIATIEGEGWDLMANHFSSTQRVSFDLNAQLAQTITRDQLMSSIAQSLDADLSITGINLDFINIQLDALSSKTVAVVLDQNIQMESGYNLKKLTVTPDSVVLRGPASLVASPLNWTTEKIDLEKLSSSTNFDILLLKSQYDQLSVHPKQVNIDIEVEQFTEKPVFVPITIKNAPDSLNIFPNKVQVNCVVGLSQFKEVTADKFKIEVDLKNTSLKSENNTLPITMTQQPNFVKQVNFSPKSVKYFFVKTDSTTTSIN